jgi:hypothetical protein
MHTDHATPAAHLDLRDGESVANAHPGACPKAHPPNAGGRIIQPAGGVEGAGVQGASLLPRRVIQDHSQVHPQLRALAQQRKRGTA